MEFSNIQLLQFPKLVGEKIYIYQEKYTELDCVTTQWKNTNKEKQEGF